MPKIEINLFKLLRLFKLSFIFKKSLEYKKSVSIIYFRNSNNYYKYYIENYRIIKIIWILL